LDGSEEIYKEGKKTANNYKENSFATTKIVAITSILMENMQL
jgi:hypothetical protein